MASAWRAAVISICLIWASPCLAEKIPDGAMKITEAEYTEIHRGKVVEGVYYSADGILRGSFVSDFTVPGVKKLVAKPKRGKMITATVEWYVKDGLLCHQGVPSMKMRCGARGLVFRKGNTCYHAHSDLQTVRFKFPC